MSFVTREGDMAGGTLLPVPSKLKVSGKFVVRENNPVAPHGSHAGATMVNKKTKIKVQGLYALNSGSIASCSHASNSSTTKLKFD